MNIDPTDYTETEDEKNVREILMTWAKYPPKSVREHRKLVVTIGHGIWGQPGTVLIEVCGSPIRTRALVTFNHTPSKDESDGSFCRNSALYIFDQDGKCSKLRAARNRKARAVIQFAVDRILEVEEI